jgi:hypothetical protein
VKKQVKINDAHDKISRLQDFKTLMASKYRRTLFAHFGQ